MSTVRPPTNPPKPLTSQQRKAAALLAEDELTDDRIAEAVGVGLRTLGHWKKRPDFLDAITEHTQRVQAAMLRLDIAKRHKRVEKLNRLEEKLFTVIEARAVDMADIPGGETGVLVRQVKQIGSGPSAQIIEEYPVDAGLIREIRALQDQAAGELGQKVDKVAVSGEMVVRRYIGVSPEDV
jgi:hypothetical protein